MKELKGMCSALCTPFTDDGEQVDEAALRTHIDSMIEAGIHKITVCGGTGGGGEDAGLSGIGGGGLRAGDDLHTVEECVMEKRKEAKAASNFTAPL